MTGGRLAAWRAAIRIARRDAWRNKGRSALIAVMIGLPVLAVSAVSVVVRSTEQDPQDVVRVSVGEQAQARLVLSSPGQAIEQSVDGSVAGQSDGQGTVTGPTPVVPLPDDLEDGGAWQRLIAAKISERDRLVPDTRIYAGAVRIGDRAVQAGLREFDYAAAGLGGLVDQVSGRGPEQADEVVVTRSLARHADVAVGDQLTLESGTRLRVVGVVGGVALTGERQVIGRPGAFLTGAGAGQDWGVERDWLVSGPDPVLWDQVLDLNRLGVTVTSRAVVADPPPSERVPYEQYAYDSGPSVTEVGVGAVIVGLFLLQIGLLAGPAIAVGARRSQRALAVVAASGGERRHLRSVVLAGSGVVGLVASLVAATLGAAVGAVATLALRRYGDVGFPRVDVHLTDLLVLVAVGALTAVAAAVVPAVQVAKLDVVAALTGRRPSASPRRRVPVLGMVIAVLGGGIAVGAAALHQSLVAVAGIALCEVGLVMATGAVVALVARPAGRLPISPRFAMRDAARQRGRTAPAVAAVMAAIAGSTAALLYQASQDRASERHYQASAGPGVVTAFAGSAEDPADVAGLTSALRRTLPVDDVVPLRYAATPAGQFVEVLPRADGPCADALPDGESALTLRQYVARNDAATCSSASQILPPGPAGLVDDGTAAGVLTGASAPGVRAALVAGKAVVFDPHLLWPGGRALLTIPDVDPDGTVREGRTLEVAAVLSGQRPGMYGVVLPEPVVQRLGLKTVANGVAATTTRLPTEAEEERAQAIALGVGNGYVYVERGYESDLTITMLVTLIAAGMITLGGTFTAVGLAAVESRPDLATFAAVGAGPALRRRISAGQAGVIAGLGTALGVASGALVGWCLILLERPVPLWIAGDWPVRSGLIGDPLFDVIVPVVPLVGVGVGMPLLAVAVGFVATRSRLPLVRRLAQ